MKVIIITRNLWPVQSQSPDEVAGPGVVSAVISLGANTPDSDVPRAVLVAFERHVNEFCEKFVEFKRAAWSYTVHDLIEG